MDRTKHVPDPDRNQMTDPYLLPPGADGVDFPTRKAYLTVLAGRGFLVVELDTSPFRAPKGSARITANYIQKTLRVPS
jgi:hypothetical protein